MFDGTAPGPSDTTREVDRIMFDLWRKATPEQRLQKVLNLGRSINELIRGRLRTQYPEATPREIELRLAARNLDRATMIKVFGWDPEVHGM